MNHNGDDCWSPSLSLSTDVGPDGWELTAPVGGYPAGASWRGALDRAGNVSEWVADWYGSIPQSGRRIPRDLLAGSIA